MRSFRELAGQTAVYGVSSILGRLLNYVLTPIYTYTLSPSEYGVVTEMYAYVAFLIVLLTFGLETAFFRYSEKHPDKDLVFSTSTIFLFVTSLVFIVGIAFFRESLAGLIRYSEHPEYILWFGLIIGMDAITSVPFARLRAQGRALAFVGIRMASIGVNFGLNLFFIVLVPFIMHHYSPGLLGDGGWYVDVRFVFISNIAASATALALLSGTLFRVPLRFDWSLMRKLLVYGLPLAVFGLAGIVNETLDRALLKYLLPPDTAMAQLGIYGACYKIAILMTIFIQAYRYAAEPFFFARASDDDARETYAHMMDYFIVVVSLIFLGTMLYFDIVIRFIGPEFREGAFVIPILLMANLFLGVFYNLSVWYKLTDRTVSGAAISVFGALITIGLNLWLIPRIGYLGSAWATFICYGTMMIVSWAFGQRYYPVPYNLVRIVLVPLSAFILWYGSTFLPFTGILMYMMNTFLLILWLLFVVYSMRGQLRLLRAR